MTHEWFDVGANLARNGVLGYRTEPGVLRSPLYPAFIAVLHQLGPGAHTPPKPGERSQAMFVIMLAQAILLALGAACLFLWLSEVIPPPLTAIADMLFGINPYAIALVGPLHYSVLHWFLLMVCGWILQRALRPGARTVATLALCGAAFGVVSLVRPVTLLLLLLLPVLRIADGRSWRWPLLTGAFGGAMLIVVARPGQRATIMWPVGSSWSAPRSGQISGDRRSSPSPPTPTTTRGTRCVRRCTRSWRPRA